MLRIIIARSHRDSISNGEWQTFETFDLVHPELEARLAGGYGENGYDFPHVMGIEIRRDNAESQMEPTE